MPLSNMIPAQKGRIPAVNLKVYFVGLQGILSLFFVTPFAVMRFLSENYLIAAIDIAIIVGMVTLSTYVIYGKGRKFVDQLAYFFALIYVVGALAVVKYSDIYAIMWTFPAAISCYFVLPARHAIAYTVFLLAVSIIFDYDRYEPVQLIIIISSYVATCWLSFILSVQVIHDRKAIENYALYDVLTGAKTRNVLMKDLQAAMEKCKSKEIDHLSLIVFDIDHFKKINDECGHQVGDHALKKVVKAVNSQLSLEQNIYRYGGEEFFILVELPVAEALVLAEKAREATEASRNKAERVITISLGVAEHLENEHLECLMKRADAALYASKEGGRNRVSKANDTAPECV